MSAANVRTESGFHDWINPIVVKELRQAVQGKFVAATLLLLLVVQLAALSIYIISEGDFTNKFNGGRDAFSMLLAILMIMSLLFVPAYTGIRLAFERDTNVDLLFVTTIKPSAIIWGKMFAALTVTVLIFSACLPFMAFTYWLRGIDIPSIFVSIATAFIVVAVSVQFATFVACIPVNRVFKVLLAFASFVVFPWGMFTTITLSFYLMSSGVGSKLGSWDFWGPATVFLLIAATLSGILFSLSVAMIKPLSANRALPVRLFVTGIWLVSGIVAFTVAYIEGDNDPIILWSILSAILFACSFFVAICERESLGVRVTRRIPESGLARFFAFFFFSGAAGGIAWAAVMALVTFAVVSFLTRGVVGSGYSSGKIEESQAWVAGFPLYILAYAMSALFVRRYLLKRWMGPKYTWVIGLLLLAAGCIIPFLVGYMIFFGTSNRVEDIAGWLITNPFLLSVDSHRSLYLSVAGDGLCWEYL